MDEFINQLLKDSGVPDNLEPEVRAELVKMLTDRATDLINRRIIDAMSDEDAVAFDKFVDAHPGDAAAVQQFVSEHVPNQEQVVAAALLELRTAYLGDKA